jgi:hypothetical protein
MRRFYVCGTNMRTLATEIDPGASLPRYAFGGDGVSSEVNFTIPAEDLRIRELHVIIDSSPRRKRYRPTPSVNAYPLPKACLDTSTANPSHPRSNCNRSRLTVPALHKHSNPTRSNTPFLLQRQIASSSKGGRRKFLTVTEVGSHDCDEWWPELRNEESAWKGG